MEKMQVVVSLIAMFFMIAFFIYRQEKEIKNIKEDQLSPDEHETVREDFLKFISDSREWAFNYIEEVQEAMASVIEILKPVITSWEKKEVLSQDQLTIREAYYKITKLLPKDQ